MRKLLILLPLLLSAAGCGGAKIPPRVDANGLRIILVPLSDAWDGPFESGRGAEIMSHVATGLGLQLNDKKTALLPARPIRDLLRKPEHGEGPWEIDPESIGEIEADLIVVGHLARFTLRDRRQVNMWQGRSEVEIHVYDTATGGMLPLRVGAAFPPLRGRHDMSNPGGLPLEYDAREIEEELRFRTAVAIAQLFYPHEPDDGHGH